MKKLVRGLLFVLLLAPLAHADEKMKMNFTNEDIIKIIQMYSKASGQKFVVDPGVRGKVSIFISEAVSLPEAFNQLSSALALNGFAISKQDDTMIVTTARNIQRNLIEVSNEKPTLKPERMYSWIYTPKHVSAMKINNDLRILPSRDGELNISPSTNQVIITDWASNLNRIAEILNKIDLPVSAESAKIIAAEKKEIPPPKPEPKSEKPGKEGPKGH